MTTVSSETMQDVNAPARSEPPGAGHQEVPLMPRAEYKRPKNHPCVVCGGQTPTGRGYYLYCDTCRDPDGRRKVYRRSQIKSKFGLTVDEYDAAIARGCAICGTHEGQICLDHDHTSGAVRDALCQRCNQAIGLLKDDPARLRAAADYVEVHRCAVG